MPPRVIPSGQPCPEPVRQSRQGTRETILRLDARTGTLEALVPDDAWQARAVALPDPENLLRHARGMGRELFAGMRRQALTAEEGACTWL